MATSEGDLTNPNLDDLPERVQQTLLGVLKGALNGESLQSINPLELGTERPSLL